jgi:hypothetical protein
MAWDQPYLETCCRSALHRLVLAGSAGRPGDLKDAGCLRRLAEMGLAARGSIPGAELRFILTPAGRDRHGLVVRTRG